MIAYCNERRMFWVFMTENEGHAVAMAADSLHSELSTNPPNKVSIRK